MVEDNWKTVEVAMYYTQWQHIYTRQTVTVKLENDSWYVIIANWEGKISTRRRFDYKLPAQELEHKFMS